MASKKDNIKALFSNTRTRIIIAFTFILLITTITIGFMKFGKSLNPLNASSDVSQTPGAIESIPGALNQTAQYSALQQQQNVEQAQEAEKKGNSSIPTIIRSQAFGEGVEAIGSVGGQGSVGFSTLARETLGGPQSTVWFQNLQDTQCSKDAVSKAVNQNNATMDDLKLACSCAQLKAVGYKLADLKSICSCGELKTLGFTIMEFKTAGYNATDLRMCGFVSCEERAAGFSAQEMKNAGYSDGELKGSGFTDREIAQAGGLPDSFTVGDVQKAGCSVDNLQRLRAAGVTAAAIRRISGCSAAQLKAAGFQADDLKNAGYSAAELKTAGFTPEQLKNAGYRARDLINAGISPDDLNALGYSAADVDAAERELPPGFSRKDIQTAGCDPEAIKRQRLAGVSAKAIKQITNCTANQLSKGGFNPADLRRAGFSPADLNPAQHLSNMELAAAGCDPTKLKALMKKGVSAKQIRDVNGCGADVLKQVGFSGKDLLDAGLTPEQLIAADFAPESFDDLAMKKIGCDATKLKVLKEQGVDAKRIHDMNGCDAATLKKAGFSVDDLAAADFTPGQLLAADFTPSDLERAGVGLNPAGILASGRQGCTPEALKAAKAMKVSAATIKQTLGCSAAAMKNAGFTPLELKDAGFSAAELKNAGFSAGDLKNAGYDAKALRAAGVSAAELKALGLDAKNLKDAGFDIDALKDAGFGADQLKAAGSSAAELKKAGFSAEALKKAGFVGKDLKDAGYTAVQLKNAGLSADDLVNAGFSSRSSALAELEKISPVQPQTSSLNGIPSIDPKVSGQKDVRQSAENAKRLEEIMKQQRALQMDQRFQQKVQQRMGQKLAAANQEVSSWRAVQAQQYTAGNDKEDKDAQANKLGGMPGDGALNNGNPNGTTQADGVTLVRMGDVLFAVIDTSVDSDEPGPILATIVTGALKGGKLIGSFNLPSNADKMVISFNALSLPGAPKTMSISAFAIDPNTARTALSSETDHHYLMRYGSLFASTFLEGFGNAFQSADTAITIGGTGGVQDTTVQNGIGRSALENAVIGLATVGKAWGQVAQQNMSRPTTVQVYSGTAVGVLFTQDLKQ